MRQLCAAHKIILNWRLNCGKFTKCYTFINNVLYFHKREMYHHKKCHIIHMHPLLIQLWYISYSLFERWLNFIQNNIRQKVLGCSVMQNEQLKSLNGETDNSRQQAAESMKSGSCEVVIPWHIPYILDILISYVTTTLYMNVADDFSHQCAHVCNSVFMTLKHGWFYVLL